MPTPAPPLHGGCCYGYMPGLYVLDWLTKCSNAHGSQWSSRTLYTTLYSGSHLGRSSCHLGRRRGKSWKLLPPHLIRGPHGPWFRAIIVTLVLFLAGSTVPQSILIFFRLGHARPGPSGSGDDMTFGEEAAAAAAALHCTAQGARPQGRCPRSCAAADDRHRMRAVRCAARAEVLAVRCALLQERIRSTGLVGRGG